MSKYPASIWRNPIHFAAFGFGSGAAPKAPGTFGSLAALPIWYLLFSGLSPLFYGVMLLVTTLLGVYLCHRTSKDLGVHDHSGIVWDEFVGVWITLFMVPAGWVWVVLGFVLFRLFDIVKPWPISWADQRVGGGLGIMLDDVLAGAMAWLVLQAIYHQF